MNKIRWGIIGCGNVTEVKSGPGFQKARGSELVAVMRRDKSKAEEYARRHGVPHVHGDVRSLIESPDVDAVYIATPPGSHCELALAVCAAGKPCYVEKPLARNHAEAVVMTRAFVKAGVPLFVAYYRRALPRFLKCRELVLDGAIGEVTSVSVVCMAARHQQTAGDLPWRLRVAESGGGEFLDLGSHALDFVDFVMGPLCDVRGSAGNLGGVAPVEDLVSLSFRTSSGAVGSGLWNFASGLHQDRIEFTGKNGRLALSCFGTEAVELNRSGETEFFAGPTPQHVQQPLIQKIVDELLGVGPSAPSSGESAARTQAVMDAALHDYYKGRQRAFWEDPNFI